MPNFQYSAGIILKIHDSAGIILNFNILLLKYGIFNILPPCIQVFCWHNLEIQHFACKICNFQYFASIISEIQDSAGIILNFKILPATDVAKS